MASSLPHLDDVLLLRRELLLEALERHLGVSVDHSVRTLIFWTTAVLLEKADGSLASPVRLPRSKGAAAAAQVGLRWVMQHGHALVTASASRQYDAEDLAAISGFSLSAYLKW